MADKDKKKLKVILKLPKSSSSQLKSPVAPPTASGGNSSAFPFSSSSASKFSPPLQDLQQRKHVVQSQHHAASSFSATHSAAFSSVRSSSATAAGSATFAAASAASPYVSSPAVHAPTPPKKRKFKSVEQAGALGVGAIVVGPSAPPAATTPAVEDVRPVKDAGGGGIASPSLVRVASPVKKSHKKQVKPASQIDGVPPQAVAGEHSQPLAGALSSDVLEGVLDKLQKKDTYGVFAEPVDPSQVPDYYDIIKEPMDFGTMRKKIKKGSYVTVDAFEGDIYLICSNAMRYNGPETIYYKQARAIRDMARKSLEAIRVQIFGDIRKSTSHKKKPPPPKKSHAKKAVPVKSRFDGAGSDFASGATLAADGEPGGWLNSTLDTGKSKRGVSLEKLVGMSEDSEGPWAVQSVATENKTDTQEEPSGAALKPMGPKDGRRPLSTEEYHRNTYKPRLLPAHGQGPPLVAVGGELRQLAPVGFQVEHAYAKSLAQFGAVLGPRAWRFVARKLQKVLAPGVPFGPGWVGEQEAPAGIKKLTVAPNQSEILRTNQVATGSSSASAMEKTNAGVTNATRKGVNSTSGSPAVLVGALPSNSSLSTKAVVQGSVDWCPAPASKAGSLHSPGGMGKPVISPSKTVSGTTCNTSSSKLSEQQSSVLHGASIGGTTASPSPVALLTGLEDLNAQAWAQVRVMSLTQQVEAKKKFTPVQGFHVQTAHVPSNGPHFQANMPQALQSSANIPQAPQSSANTPQALKLSANMSQTLQSSANVPQFSVNGSQNLQSSANVPQYPVNVSKNLQSSANVPQFSASVSQNPQSSANVAQFSASGSKHLQSSANMPQYSGSVSQNLQSSANMPQYSGNVSQNLQSSANMPQYSSNISQNLQSSANMSQFSGNVSQNLQSSGNMPQYSGNVSQNLQSSANMPQFSANVSQNLPSSANMSQFAVNVSQNLQSSANIPLFVANVSHNLHSANVPQFAANVSQALQSSPNSQYSAIVSQTLQSSSNVPLISGNVPQARQFSGNGSPNGQSSIPQMSVAVPPMSTNSPQLSANGSQMSAGGSQMAANASQLSSHVSQNSSNLPQILQPYMYGDYKQLFVRLPSQQSTVMSGPSNSHLQPATSGMKSGSMEQLGTPNFHTHMNIRPMPSLQQTSLQQRAMPPDLNVALVSPSSLRSPPSQQGSTPRSTHQLDLKLQL